MFYLTEYIYTNIGEKKLSTTLCPDCGHTDCLTLLFYQKKIDTTFTYRVTKKVAGILHCSQTDTEINEILWSDAIVNYFETEKSKYKLEPTNFRIKPVSYFVVIVLIAAISGFIGYNAYNHNQYNLKIEKLNAPQIDQKIKVNFTTKQVGEITQTGTTWFVVRKILGDTLWLQQHDSFIERSDRQAFDLNTTKFSGIIIKVDKKSYGKSSIRTFKTKKKTYGGWIEEAK